MTALVQVQQFEMDDNSGKGEELWVDTDRQEVAWHDRREALTGRWDAAFLACLVPDDTTAEPLELDARAMAAALAPYGLTRALTATEWGRILDRVSDKLVKLSGDRPPIARIAYAPRHKTGGPWRLDSMVRVRSIHAPAMPPSAPRRGSATGVSDLAGTSWLLLSDDEDPRQPVLLANRLKQAVEAMWKALPDQAIGLLNNGQDWQHESLALGLLRRLRLAEAVGSTGHHAAARAVLSEVQTQLREPGLSAIFQPHASLLALRLDYGESPVDHYARVQNKLAADLSSYWSTGVSRIDATAWAEHLHLAALCQRRRLERGDSIDCKDAVKELTNTFHAAFVLFMLVRNYERAQHVCANLAYAHQKLAQLSGAPHWDLAVDWHLLSFAMHATFGGAESSAWEYIYIGELWLSSPEAQVAFHRRMRQPGWNDMTPDRPHFYEEACRIARQLGDPRQQAYTLLNRYRFQLTNHMPLLRQVAQHELERFLMENPAQHRLLESEGYPLPRVVAVPTG